MDFYSPAIKTEASSNPASWTSFPSIERCSNRRLACMLEEVILKWQIQQI